MSQRFCLFFAGYTVSAPSLYYDQLVLNDQLKDPVYVAAEPHISILSESLEEMRQESVTHIETVMSIAAELEVAIPEKPDSAAAYPEWKRAVLAGFENSFPMTRIDHYYFLFGRRLAEIVCNAGLLASLAPCLKGSEKNPLLLRKADKLLKDTEYLLFKMMAPAALLSGEHRHHYFSIFFKEISSRFNDFTGIDIKELSDEQLEKLGLDATGYKTQVIDGFKKCIGLLKELNV